MRADARVTCIEGVNARTLAKIGEPFDLIVADVSFISLTKVLPQWPALLASQGRILSLVKPQFEVGADNLARGGIVRDAALYVTVETSIRAACSQAGLRVLDYFDSSITGTDGNREFFVYAQAAGKP
jgi:23S rRNA (cytidine1920-2'-O)/16S rRNA (cytidine1409-2'-O)-methyltransferase